MYRTVLFKLAVYSNETKLQLEVELLRRVVYC